MAASRIRSQLARAAIAALAAVMLAAASSPVDLMPAKGRSMPFGPRAAVQLTQAAERGPNRFGRRPALDRGSTITWDLVWNGAACEVRNEPYDSDPDGTLALRRLEAGSPLYIGVLGEASPVEAGQPPATNFQYFLLWRLSAHEFIGYLRLFGSECETLPPQQLHAIGLTDEEAKSCVLQNWTQVEALMRAFAATRPAALGTMRLLRRSDHLR